MNCGNCLEMKGRKEGKQRIYACTQEVSERTYKQAKHNKTMRTNFVEWHGVICFASNDANLWDGKPDPCVNCVGICGAEECPEGIII